MTCIVGVEHPRGAWIGADSIAVAGDEIDISITPKIWRDGHLVVAVCGHYDSIAVVRGLVLSRLRAPSTERLVCHEIPRAITAALTAAAISDESSLGLVIGIGAEAWYLGDGGHGGYRSHYGYVAGGSGSPYALGSLASTAQRSAKSRAEIALGAADRHCGSVASPFKLLRA